MCCILMGNVQVDFKGEALNSGAYQMLYAVALYNENLQ